MSKYESFDYEDDSFRAYLDEPAAVVNIKKNVLENLVDFDAGARLNSFYEMAREDRSVSALLVVNEEGSYGQRQYNRFLKRVAGRASDDMNLNLPKENKQVMRAREINMLQQMATRFVEFPKLLVLGLNQRVVTPMFGVSLAADFRFGTEDLSFSLAHMHYGLHPSGGLAFFLPRFVGQGKAIEMLMKGGEIKAEEALELGLVHDILPKEGFERAAVERTKALCEQDVAVISATKKLAYDFIPELKRHFEREYKISSAEIKNVD